MPSAYMIKQSLQGIKGIKGSVHEELQTHDREEWTVQKSSTHETNALAEGYTSTERLKGRCHGVPKRSPRQTSGGSQTQPNMSYFGSWLQSRHGDTRGSGGRCMSQRSSESHSGVLAHRDIRRAVTACGSELAHGNPSGTRVVLVCGGLRSTELTGPRCFILFFFLVN